MMLMNMAASPEGASYLLEAALPPLAARADAYTPRCLGSSPVPRLFIALPPRQMAEVAGKHTSNGTSF